MSTQCPGTCKHGTQPCTCEAHMPIPAGWAASSCTEVGQEDEDEGAPWTAWELVAAVALVSALLLACWVPAPGGVW